MTVVVLVVIVVRRHWSILLSKILVAVWAGIRAGEDPADQPADPGEDRPQWCLVQDEVAVNDAERSC